MLNNMMLTSFISHKVVALCDLNFLFLCLQVAGLGHGNDAFLHPERHTQGSVQKYSQNAQVFPDFCISRGKNLCRSMTLIKQCQTVILNE